MYILVISEYLNTTRISCISNTCHPLNLIKLGFNLFHNKSDEKGLIGCVSLFLRLFGCKSYNLPFEYMSSSKNSITQLKIQLVPSYMKKYILI